MRPRPPLLSSLATIPIDRFLTAAAERLRHATVDEIATILEDRGTAIPSADRLAEMVVALPDKGSKLEIVQAAVVTRAIAMTGGNVSAAARLLGMDRKQLERKLARARRRRAR
jgi:ActR/RegA family two-component response regulator